MGHDITTLSNHNLNTSSLETLALDLFNRLDVNIEYGFFGDKDYNKLLNTNYTNNFVVIDRLIKNKALDTFRLTEENYLEKELIKKQGKEIIKTPQYWRLNAFNEDELFGETTDKEVEEKLKELKLKEYLFEKIEEENDDDYYDLQIYEHFFENNMFYFSRWWCFCDFFTEKNGQVGQEHLTEFRKTLRYYTKTLGGTKTYYLDDQSDCLEGVGGGEEIYLNWQELEKFVQKKSGIYLIDIPKYFTDKTYQKECLTVWKNQVSFVDDFSDLKQK